MKKIALCSLLVCLTPCVLFAGTVTEACYTTSSCGARDSIIWKIGGGAVGWAGGSVIGTGIMPGLGSWAGAIGGGYYGWKLGGKLGHAYRANEYIYFDDGTCLECDTHQVGENYECPNGAIVTNGDIALKCKTTLTGDYWEETTIPVCSDSPVKTSRDGVRYKTILRDNITNNGKTVHDGVLVFSGAVCLYITEESVVADQCTFYDGSKHNLGDKVEVDCSQAPNTPEFQQNARTGVKCYQSCLRRLSDNALTNYWSVKTCPADKGFVAFDSADYQKYTPDIPGYKRCDVNELPEIVVTPEKKKSCKNSRSTANGKTCCDLSASEATYDAANDRCNCLNNKEFKIENDKGVCVAPQSTTANCKYKFKSIITCANGQYMSVDKETMVEAADCDEFNRLYGADLNKAMEIFGDLCAGVSPIYVPVHVNVDPIAFQNASNKLKRFADSAKGEASGWKTADGKFNTTRLASDLSAGVVLGTVGGVVSGVVIKKKQVEKGFDALHCTVGGQKIADWGDEFSVGLQR